MKSLLTKIVASLLAAVLLAAPVSAGRPSFLDSVRPLQVMYVDRFGEFFDTICTTSSINDQKGYWLTAAHCVDRDEQYFIDRIQASVVEFDPQADLAVLMVPGLKVKSLKMQPRNVDYDQEISVAGFPLGYPSMFWVRGRVIHPYGDILNVQKVMLLQVPVAPGHSGSPVFNKKGEVVSVLRIGWGARDGHFSSVSGGASWPDMVRVVWKYFKR